jgi:hypothetical protein
MRPSTKKEVRKRTFLLNKSPSQRFVIKFKFKFKFFAYEIMREVFFKHVFH